MLSSVLRSAFRVSSISLLEGIASQKKVSLAWVVRDAAESYVADKWPLFGRTGVE